MSAQHMKDAFKLGDKYIIRLGYSGFFSAVLMMWRMNRNARKLGLVTKAEIVLPLRWFK